VEDEDGDGLFGEEAQKFRGTGNFRLLEMKETSHNMSSNHPRTKEQFINIFSQQNSPFYARERR
jgi:hypothetical protein